MIVMIVCHFDQTNPTGGLEKQARLLARSLVEAGEEVTLLSSTRSLAGPRRYDDGGVSVRLFWTYASPQISGRYLPAALLWAVQLLAWIVWHRSRITVLHGHQIRIHAFVMALAHRWFGLPTVLKAATGGDGADIRTIGSRKYLGPAGRRFVIANTTAFVATTETIRADYRAYGVDDRRIRVIPNGLVIGPAEPEPAEVRSRRFVFLGRIAADKNVLALAEAALRASRRTPLELDIWGDGDQVGELRHMLDRAGSDRVRYRGWTDDTRSVLGHYGFLVLPSSAEGLSNAMIEAFANGVVPLTTRVSGCVDHIVDGRNGFFLAGTGVDDIDAGLERAASLRTDEWIALSDNARAHAASHFAIAGVVRRYRDLYRCIAPAKREPAP